MSHHLTGSHHGNHMDPQSLATGLGWFSIALGVAELVSPGSVTRTLGLRGTEPVVRAFGMREIVTGVGLLSARNPAPWLWARVAGDMLDIASAATAMNRHNPHRNAAGVAIASLIGVTLVDVMAARAAQAANHERSSHVYDYSDRSGMPRSPSMMRGAALDDDLTDVDHPFRDDRRGQSTERPGTAGWGAEVTAGA
ncbi:hypothetical protein [Chthonobacter rhizosphaerae]|uniref:hypothetical protein n=1 Tax=Chthonobacter rhizosphaerae TaxID=2735553 RepID=UPI0015EF248B|nr:hypothetical protein [Chthonobacter rhizosphaerae]